MQWVYLDNNATTKPGAQVVQAVQEVNQELWANPSSMHRLGQQVRQRIELARAKLAELINCHDRELVFTSGGTESNNLALRGVLGRAALGDQAGVLITSAIEHSSIRELAHALAQAGVTLVNLPINRDGLIDPEDLGAALDQHAKPTAATLVSIHWANNETGVIEPMNDLVQVVLQFREAHRGPSHRGRFRGRGQVLVHTDATQAVGKIPVDVQAVPVDLLTLSAHKFHGPKGVGALYIRQGVQVRAQQVGGAHERERRGGTENTLGIIGMGVGAELAKAFLNETDRLAKLAGLRDELEKRVISAVPQAVVNCADAPRLWNTTNIAFPRLEAEAILLGLSEKGLCASAGAACSSGSLDPSPVLLAMGIGEAVAHGSVRFSLSRFTTQEEIDQASGILPQVVERLMKTLPMPA